MGMDRKALLRKIAESSVTSGGNNIRDGRGRLAIKKLSLEDKFNGAVFVAEFVVVSSSKIPVTALSGPNAGKALDIEPNEPASEVSWVQLLDKHINALGNVKGFVLEIYGFKADEITNDDFMDTLDVLTKENKAEGMLLDFSTYRKVTDTNKVEIVIPKWSSVDQSEEDIKNTKKWLVSLLATQKQAAAQAPASA